MWKCTFSCSSITGGMKSKQNKVKDTYIQCLLYQLEYRYFRTLPASYCIHKHVMYAVTHQNYMRERDLLSLVSKSKRERSCCTNLSLGRIYFWNQLSNFWFVSWAQIQSMGITGKMITSSAIRKNGYICVCFRCL